jgi:hypothetical protein
VAAPLDLVIATEIALPPDDRGALEEVAGAVGRPGIADIVVPGEDENTCGAQHLQGRQSETAGTMRDERNAGFRHRFRRRGGFAFGDVAEAETVADRDLAA